MTPERHLSSPWPFPHSVVPGLGLVRNVYVEPAAAVQEATPPAASLRAELAASGIRGSTPGRKKLVPPKSWRAQSEFEGTSIQLGDEVAWAPTGAAKFLRGQVEAVVPAGSKPSRERFPQFHRYDYGGHRDHESYVVRVRGTAGIDPRYWPPVADLLKLAPPATKSGRKKA